MAASDSAERLIEQLQLQPHPEGGWYRETWRAEAEAGERSGGTAILFLLKNDERSHWHRVDADELWLWQGGDPLELRIARGDDETPERLILGSEIANGHMVQGLVPIGAWQAASPANDQNLSGYSLVSCVVVPGFDFAGFELAPENWEPGQ